MNRLALFDCDGTLVDSQHTICTAMDDAFIASRLDPPGRAATLRIVGLSIYEAIQALLPEGDDALHRQLAQDYKAAFHRMRGNGQVDEPLYAGIAETIDALETAGWTLGVATGKSDRGLALCLAHHGLTDKFVTLQTASRHPSKPHPAMIEAAMAEAGASPATTVMIGDTSFDMAMAVAAGTRALGVAWGYHPVEELHHAGADAVVAHPREIPAALEPA
ncbi:HAD-IA family hydrolase [Sphingomonas sp.]|uniref:HAD-IA family hydrolase n=1 Tax=Sphingomonas sp. TaxID=28214 RepID=UPI0025E92F49|nr:HAD-IA family hydrolase [Sphingomonas sp.]